MAITIEQLKNLGFKPSVRGRGGLGKIKKYDSLIYPINDTDFLYTGYNPYKKQINYKTIWKSFKDEDGNRITYQVVNLGDTGLIELKSYITNTLARELSKELIHTSAYIVSYDSPMAVEEGSLKAPETELSEIKEIDIRPSDIIIEDINTPDGYVGGIDPY